MENVKTDLVYLISGTANEFIDTFDKFSEEQVNQVPFPGSWTPGQVAHHIIKATGDIPDKYTEATDRRYDEKVKEIESVFLDFSVKMKSPDFVVPADGPFNKAELTNNLKGILEKHKTKIAAVDLSAICLKFELPGTGPMTRYEWYRFIVAHTKRHLFQLTNILNSY